MSIFVHIYLIFNSKVEALLGDLKRQMKDLSTAYPQPDHDGQFITQQSIIAVKEDPEDEEDPPQSL